MIFQNADDHLQSVNGIDYAYKSDCAIHIMALQGRDEKGAVLSAGTAL
ncbi:MAG: hypothetical protein KJ630_21575 [Proteobacteria bacterium]|nr:hypothetical protein [Pseudomonadota bacterium]